MRLRWILLWTAVCLSCAIVGTSIYWELDRQEKLRRTLAGRQEEMAALSDEIQRTRDRLEFYRTDEGQAWIARDRLNIAFPGERIYRIEIPQDQVLPEETK